MTVFRRFDRLSDRTPLKMEKEKQEIYSDVQAILSANKAMKLNSNKAKEDNSLMLHVATSSTYKSVVGKLRQARRHHQKSTSGGGSRIGRFLVESVSHKQTFFRVWCVRVDAEQMAFQMAFQKILLCLQRPKNIYC